MSKTKKIIIGLIVGIVLLIGIGISLSYFHKSNEVVTVLTMDINPSIVINLNYKNKVINAEGLNDDGKELLKEKKLKGNSLEKAIENITELVIEKGYITEEENHILINVNGKNIKDDVVALINSEFKEKNAECHIIIPEVSDESKEIAEKYGISDSKASYIESIIKKNEEVTFEELKDKSINEINQIIKEKEEQKKLEEEQKRLEEEQKRLEEEKKRLEEEQKKQQNNNSSTSSSTQGGTGSISLCSTAVFNYENDDISRKVWSYLGTDSVFGTETVANVYNNKCTYRTTLTYNHVHYVYYHDVTTGELIHKTQEAWVATDMDSQMSYSLNYFINKKGVLKEEVVAGNYCNDSLINSHVTCAVVYNGQKYEVTIDRKTGNGVSITP